MKGYASRLLLGFLAILGFAGAHANAQHLLQNVGHQLFYEHEFVAYDTTDRDAGVIQQLDDFSRSGEGSSPITQAGSVAGNVVISTSTGTGSDTMDIRASSALTAIASIPGFYNEEAVNDGIWDHVTGRVNTKWVLHDIVTANWPDDRTTGIFYFEWKSRGNKLDTELVAGLGPPIDTPFGPAAQLLNGFQTEITYDATLRLEPLGGPTIVQPIASDSIPLASPTTVLTQMQTQTIPDKDVSFALPLFKNVPLTFEAQFEVELIMELLATTGQPSIDATLDFANTIDSVLFEIRDEQGNPIEGATITSEAGINYAAATAIPEPSAALFALLAGVGFVCWAGIRRRLRWDRAR